MFSLGEMYEFNMEWALTRACFPCMTCVAYFDARQNVLKPEMLRIAKEQKLPPVDILVGMRIRYHKRHTEGK